MCGFFSKAIARNVKHDSAQLSIKSLAIEMKLR